MSLYLVCLVHYICRISERPTIDNNENNIAILQISIRVHVLVRLHVHVYVVFRVRQSLKVRNQ